MAATDNDRFKKLLAEIRQKYTLQELRPILKDEELGTAPGWDQLGDRLTEGDPALRAKAEKVLKRLHGDLILAGTKDVHIFDLPKDQASYIAAGLEKIEPSSPNYGEAYPLTLSETVLHSLPTDHELVAKVAHESGDISLIYCARRTVEEQVRYDTNQVTAAVRDAFVGFDEFIAIRRMDYQIFDVLTVRPKLGRLEVLIDYPDRIRLPESTEARCLTLLGRTMTLVPELQTIYEQNEPLNLLACINNLYQAKSEGRVSRLSFRSPTDSVKKESMTSHKDLRTEPFHAAGVTAVGDITPYDVTVAWEGFINAKGAVSVRVGAPISALSSADAYVRTARISGARSDASIAAVVNKLVSYST
ncbi:MAG: hypothetical protein EOO23_06110 [Comamonadaceae bacterium]|nr:MAG: hypothetical protein EOO23_06110 [Comamonadaceae bacterium]